MTDLPEDIEQSTNWQLPRDPNRKQRLLELIDRVWSLPDHADIRRMTATKCRNL